MSPRKHRKRPAIVLAAPPIIEPERAWSTYQHDIFDWFASRDTENLIVRARAGTGKTTTILEGVSRRAGSGLALVCAFNKRIEEELSARLARSRTATAEAMTLHSLGFKCVRSVWPKIAVDRDRGCRLAEKAWEQDFGKGGAPRPVVRAIDKLAGLVKGMAPRATEADALRICLGMNVEVDGELADDYPPKLLADLARRALGLAKEYDGSIDFDDMLWLPVEHRWMRPTYSLLVVDEAQDMNRTQLELAMGLAAGRIAVVGDDRQAIYGFRGADSSALDRLKEELHADELPLTITYRCPKAVVAIAQALVPGFAAADAAPEGIVEHCTVDAMIEGAAPGDFILSRVNAPLSGICLKLLRDGKTARVQGRDIGASLGAFVRRMRAQKLIDLMPRMHAHREHERDRMKAMPESAIKAAAVEKLDALSDQIETIEALADGLETADELRARIDTMFLDKGPADMVVCSSIHKAKGLEAPRVYVLEWTLYCNGRRPEEIEEANLHYVAITRAMHTLVLVQKDGGPVEPGKPALPSIPTTTEERTA